ncbi:MarR family winged helix-turn-helix transcriptional regulator [Halomonas sp. HNIBRBA4712]|uniref:MarR family winged helix-turn-helix transcriptional regulator n=1 Tax=Halomonas sp. HNIBRBA4712 TaxID=3373087 RepID=UPI003746525F
MVDKEGLSSSFFPLANDFRSRDFPFYWVARLNAKHGADVDSLLKPHGLSSSKWRILMILHEHGRLSMSEISVHAVAKLSTITKTVYRMQEAGLLITEASQQDGRVTEVDITPLGEEKLDIARQVTSRLVKKAFGDFSAQEIIYINQCLSKMFHNLSSI